MGDQQESEVLLAVTVLTGVHDRFDSAHSDPPPDAGGDTPWPEGDSLNQPAS